MKKVLTIGLMLSSALFLTACGSVKEVQTVNVGDEIVVDYAGRLTDGTVFDTSIESVARESGLYTEGRNYDEGLAFTAGAGQMIAGFDAAVIGMEIGETKTVEIPAEEAYGQRDESLTITYALSEVPNPEELEIGQQIWFDQGMAALIIDKTDTEVVFDLNHQLAGEDLIFDITIKSIN